MVDDAELPWACPNVASPRRHFIITPKKKKNAHREKKEFIIVEEGYDKPATGDFTIGCLDFHFAAHRYLWHRL